MDKKWWAGEPETDLPNLDAVGFDEHSYVMYATSNATRAGYLAYSCSQDPTDQQDDPVIVGEWSLAATDASTNPEFVSTATGAQAFYYKWASAQLIAYNKAAGSIFWTWHTDTLNTPRWDYQLAVEQGYLPANASAYDTAACDNVIGFGTWQSAPGEVAKAVEVAIKAGYKHLDLAKVYQNQKEVAEGIKKGGVKREELFITSKLWNNSHKPELVEAALDDTLAELELTYLDLYLIHWPVAFAAEGDLTSNLFPKDGDKVKLDTETSLVQTWKAVTELVKTGKVKNVGVSNFTPEFIDILIKETGVTPAVNQIERHPRLQQPELIKYHAEKNIHITAYSPLGNNNVGIPLLFENDQVKAVAEKVGATPAQVLIKWGQIGGHSIIPKSVTPSRIESNLAATEVKLGEDDIAVLDKLGEDNWRFNVPYDYKPQWDINIWNYKNETKATHKVKTH